MYSAFGVDYGEISKGLPSALRAAQKTGDTVGSMGGYANMRIWGNTIGRHASRTTGGPARLGDDAGRASRSFKDVIARKKGKIDPTRSVGQRHWNTEQRRKIVAATARPSSKPGW